MCETTYFNTKEEVAINSNKNFLILHISQDVILDLLDRSFSIFGTPIGSKVGLTILYVLNNEFELKFYV